MKLRSILIGLLIATAASLASARPVRAGELDGERMYVELGTFHVADESMPVVELRFGSVTPLRPSTEFTFPVALDWAMLLMPELDVTLPTPVGRDLLVIPRAGATMLLVATRDGGGHAFGWNAGAGLVLHPERRLLVRLDYTMRTLIDRGGSMNGVMRTVSAGVGFRY